MIDTAAAYLKQLGAKRVGILATDGTIKEGLYQKACARYGMEAVLPSEETQKKVMEIKNVLADNGWKFASCTYSYIADCRNTEKQVLIDDFVKWQDQIGSLFGEVHILVYPNGNYIYGTDDRAVYFKNRGFRIFFGGGATPYHIYGDNYLFVDRAMMSYTTLNRKAYKDLFDYNEIIDPVRTQNTDKKNT